MVYVWKVTLKTALSQDVKFVCASTGGDAITKAEEDAFEGFELVGLERLGPMVR